MLLRGSIYLSIYLKKKHKVFKGVVEAHIRQWKRRWKLLFRVLGFVIFGPRVAIVLIFPGTFPGIRKRNNPDNPCKAHSEILC